MAEQSSRHNQPRRPTYTHSPLGSKTKSDKQQSPKSSRPPMPKESQGNKDIASEMSNKIEKMQGLSEYKTRDLIEDTEKLGQKLSDKGLKTTQVRKFLDAINQAKSKINSSDKSTIESVKSGLPLLRAQLAYATARQQKNNNPGPVEPLKVVLDAAIKKVRDEEEYFLDDFHRLSQLIESIIAYHRYAGGRDQ